MQEDFIHEELTGTIKNIGIFSKRLYMLSEYLNLENANTADKITVCNFLNELAYNVQIEINNMAELMITN